MPNQRPGRIADKSGSRAFCYVGEEIRSEEDIHSSESC